MKAGRIAVKLIWLATIFGLFQLFCGTGCNVPCAGTIKRVSVEVPPTILWMPIHVGKSIIIMPLPRPAHIEHRDVCVPKAGQ